MEGSTRYESWAVTVRAATYCLVQRFCYAPVVVLQTPLFRNTNNALQYINTASRQVTMAKLAKHVTQGESAAAVVWQCSKLVQNDTMKCVFNKLWDAEVYV